MTTLNKAAAEAAGAIEGVHAVTDVTGYGLLGHLKEMTAGSRVHARIAFHDVPLLPGVLELASEGFVPGGTKCNHQSLAGTVHWDPSLTQEQQLILSDAQTSGGLLIALPADRAHRLLAELSSRGVESKQIGTFTDESPRGSIDVLP
jgi:selenide,water dikinase